MSRYVVIAGCGLRGVFPRLYFAACPAGREIIYSLIGSIVERDAYMAVRLATVTRRATSRVGLRLRGVAQNRSIHPARTAVRHPGTTK